MDEDYNDPPDPTGLDPIETDERDTPDFWRRWVKSAERAAEPHWRLARAAWDEYENRDQFDDADTQRCYPIYWSSSKVIEPAFYSKTPKITTRRRFDINDDVAISGCLAVERLGQYLVDQCEFDAVMQAAVGDYVHADKTTTQLMYEHNVELVATRQELMPQGAEFITADGDIWTAEVLQDETGYFGELEEEMPTEQYIYLTSCRYDEILHTPDAKCESEIRERAYYFYMARDEAEKRFGEKAKLISWKSKKESSRKNDQEHERAHVDAVGEYVEGWEIWSKPNRRVYWISDQCAEGFLDDKDDPYGLKEFFPSPPFIIGSKPSKHLYPTPVYAQVRPLLEELHTSSAKISRLISAIRRRALVDPSVEDVVYLLESSDDLEFVVAKNFGSIVEKGGVQNIVQYLPVQELVQAINELTQLQDKFKNEFYEWFGVPDILRGATEPLESASAQQLKAESAHDRFKWAKKQVAQLARNSIEMMVDLALEVFTDEKIAECVGYDYMDPEDQQRFPAALEMLRNDEARTIRLEIESDSMSFVDDQLRINQTNQTVKVITAGLKEVAQMIQISPQAATVGLQALLLSLDAMPAGKEFQDEVKQTLQELIEQAKQPPAPTPPPPDYELLKIQLQQQKAQMDAQLEQQKLQLEMQAKMRDLDRRDYELQLKAGSDVADNRLEQLKETYEQQLEQFMAQLEAQRVAIEQFKAQMQARESMMEEIRLAREVDAKAYQVAVETAEQNPPQEPTPPVLNVINVQGDSTPDAVLPVVNPVIDPLGGGL